MLVQLPDGTIQVLGDAYGTGLGAFVAGNPDIPPERRAMAAAGAVPPAIHAGVTTGALPESFADVGKDLGYGLGATAAGYGIYNAATNPNLSTKQKAGHAGGVATDAVASYLIPYYGWAAGINAIGQGLEGSGSPQVRGLGRSFDQLATPSGGDAFRSVLQGDASPKAAFRNAGGVEGLVTDLLGPVGVIAKGLGVDKKVARGVMDFGPIPGGGKLASMLGLDSKPTTGTIFRRELSQVFDKVGIKGADFTKYNVDLSKFSRDQIDQANTLAQKLAAMSPTSQKNPDKNYFTQATGILLNSFGGKVPQIPGLNAPTETDQRLKSLASTMLGKKAA